MKARHVSPVGLALLLGMLAGCSQIDRPKVEPFYAVHVPPLKQELKWSNGKMPVTLDPARAAAAPETDLVRAAYEGLTDLDSRTLQPAPAVAKEWRSSDDLRTWTFHLRNDAKWSNGDPVTAHDFVRSFRRLAELGDKAANSHLFQNIVGMGKIATPDGRLDPATKQIEGVDSKPTPSPGASRPSANTASVGSNIRAETDRPAVNVLTPSTGEDVTAKTKAGVVAIDDHTLQIQLYIPDKDLPKLVASPIFRPVFGDGKNFDRSPLDENAETNGAFRVSTVDDGSVTLIRSDTYWNKRAVALEQVRFIAADSAEEALEAYKNGSVDVVTNAPFEPVAAKVLAPFEDFRKTAHNALNFYEVNANVVPFHDRRVRQALALSIDREKLTDGDLQGTTQPAYSFSPLRGKRPDGLTLDVKKANDLLDKAGYPDGLGFPPIRLVINRNDVQQRIAGSIARMWKQNLNLQTVIVVKEAAEMEEVRQKGEFDLIRRGVVFAANDELVNLAAVHGASQQTTPIREASPSPEPADPSSGVDPEAVLTVPPAITDEALIDVFTEAPDKTDEALFEMRAIPLYFPTSYSLVKPYIRGFELNVLDAASLKEVSIDNEWQPNRAE